MHPSASIDSYTVPEAEKFYIKNNFLFIHTEDSKFEPNIGINLKSIERYTVIKPKE